MRVSDYGASWVSALVPGSDGKVRDVLLGYDDAAGYEAGGEAIGAIVGRVANRTGGAEFELNGKVYHLSKNKGNDNLHSGPDVYQKRIWKTLLSSFSLVEIVPEKLMDTVTAVSGSSPAYVFMFIEAMADAAVLDGMPRAQAYKFAAQAVLGSAKMVLDTGKHPGELKDMVCSPAGTTIDAVRVLEECGFRGTIIDAVQTCAEKSRSL